MIYLCAILSAQLMAQTESISRKWNNIVLEGIRNDFARPTIHARNLYHHSVICYDAWAIFNPTSPTVFLGQTFHGYPVAFNGISLPQNKEEAREIAISYASYRFIQNRYSNSPDYPQTLLLANNLMAEYGLDPAFTSTDYVNDGAPALGNYLAEQIQLYGLIDGANELNDYDNLFYSQINPPLDMSQPGNASIQDPNHWQPLSLETLIDQSGNLITTTQPHLSPEWGDVTPFSLKPSMAAQLSRDGMNFNVYFDSLKPAYIVEGDTADWDSFYKWNHTLVSVWQSHLDTSDGVVWDISPASIGNNTWYPQDSSEFAAFYDLTNGGDPGAGHAINPETGLPYTPQLVRRSDYARVLAEFWADGIDSETPAGHWFEIYHYVSDQPSFERRWKGVGQLLDTLEYDVKAHLTLGGTMHDAAIAAWSLKGYYDYLRPVSAIRYMADQGQSSEPLEPNFHPDGIPLLPGYVESVQVGDPLAGQWNENVGKIKLFTWRGHEYINNPSTDFAGVGWILAENWWPYQRPTFVTPPFAGFVSGHSTFSRAAAHTLEFITGSAFFPGGMGEFVAPMNEFLQFEVGPSDTIRLQWATYVDASDQCSLSRIWGGIHPPIDDIPGRMIGDVVGPMASQYADSIFSQFRAGIIASSSSDTIINVDDIANQFTLDFEFNSAMDTALVPTFSFITTGLDNAIGLNEVIWIDSFKLQVSLVVLSSTSTFLETEVQLSNMITGLGGNLENYTFKNYFIVDTKIPELVSVTPNPTLINDQNLTTNLDLVLVFDEVCDTTIAPSVSFQATNYVNPTLVTNTSNSYWLNDSTYNFNNGILDYNETINNINVLVSGITDLHENQLLANPTGALFEIDTENPIVLSMVSSDTLITQENLSSPLETLTINFSEDMDVSVMPTVTFLNQGNPFNFIVQNPSLSNWINPQTLEVTYAILNSTNNLIAIDVLIENVRDINLNDAIDTLHSNVLWSDMKSPEIISAIPNTAILNDDLIGVSNYYVDIVFDEPMDTTVIPSALHFGALPVGGSIQYNVPESKYLDLVTFRALFQIIDENIEVAPITLQVGFAEDKHGNILQLTALNNFIELDTKNPQVTGCYANNTVLNQWEQVCEIIIVYDEPMNQTQFPDVQFIGTPINFPMVSDTWLSPTNYEVSYQLSEIPSDTYYLNAAIQSAKDIAGNNQVDFTATDFLLFEPFVGLEDVENENIRFFPNPISANEKLVFTGLNAEGKTIEVRCLNAIGQELKPLTLSKVGDKYISKKIDLTPGWYVLRVGAKQFKMIVR